MRAVVLHHGGTVEAVGDAVHAVFGVPAAHEDDALRAVRAAAGMHATLDELNEWLAADARVRLEAHTGVNTGEVVAGDPNLGSLVVGEAVNLAARLEQAAGPGEILLGRRTWRLVRDAVEVGPPEVVAVPGRKDGEPAYRLLAVRPETAGRARRLDAPFVGRAPELQLFRWAYERAVGEAALHLLTVLGGPGVGKTRMVLEAAGRLGGDPAVLVGRCLPYGNGSTFWPLAEVVFDDLHWAEPTFLDLLEQLAETTHEGPILLVAVARPELLEQRPGWAGGLLALGRALGQLGRITSEGPDFQVKAQDSRDALAAAVQAVLAEEAGDRPVDPKLLATLTEALAAAFDQGR
jgi:hypothetical protein